MMKNYYFSKIFSIIILSLIPLKMAMCEIFIIAKVNNQIITNLDLEFEKKYLTSLNPNLKKLDQNRIKEYAKDSLINEKIKKIEIEKMFEIIPNEQLLNKVIGDIYSGIGIANLDEFKNYLVQNNVDFERVKRKISIEMAWNDLIVNRFTSQIEIDQDLLKLELDKFSTQKIENILLSEIIFTINERNQLDTKYNEIKESIKQIGFEDTARIYSLSDSKKNGGNLGWIYKNQLSKEINIALKEINVGDFTKPIISSGGFLILKLNDIKIENVEIDKDLQLNKMIEFERNRQLTRYSTLHYKRVYNNAEINEK